MKLDTLIAQLTSIRDASPEPQTVLVVVQGQGSVGSTPGVEVASVVAGFDWDKGRVLLRTAEPVVALSPEQVEDIQESVRRGGSWHAYQAYRKQAQKRGGLRRQITDLQRQGDISVRALGLADRAMFEILECEGVRLDEHGASYGLTDVSCSEVDTLAEASEDLREAVEWLRERSYVELVDGPDGAQSVVVLRALE